MDSLSWHQPGNPTIDWSAALDRHGSWLRKVVNARVQPHDVDDVLQEISTAVLQQQTRPDDPQQVAPWLYGVAVRQASQCLRKQGRQERLLAHYAEKAAPSDVTSENPRDWVMLRERQQSVRDCLSQLDPDAREILVLKYTEELTYAQLAQLFGISEKMVEHRLLKARNALRVHLQKQEP